jgi:5'-nucleotidase
MTVLSAARALTGILLLSMAVPLTGAAQDARPHILVVNDDGIAADGIAAMADALKAFADVVVVAPHVDASGASHSTVVRRIRAEVEPHHRDGEVFGYSINATPADAAKFGIMHFGAERPFDLVVSGINEGANTGNIAHYSGTVGAAMEALYQGIPAVATSQDAQQDYALTARITADIVQQVLREGLPPGVLLSINVPRGDLRGIRAAAKGGAYFGVGSFELVEDRDGGGASYRSIVRGAVRGGEHTDTAAYLDGYVTVTPIRFDWTDYETLSRLQGWNLSLEEHTAAAPR